jgi:flavin-dependent dehydrogenase
MSSIHYNLHDIHQNGHLEHTVDDKSNRDLIVIGGGLAGLSSALTAAGKGMDVLVLEMKEVPDTDGVIDELCYPHALKLVLSDYQKFQTTFTPLTRRAFWILTGDSHTAFECISPVDDLGRSGYVASRPELDNLLVDRLIALGGSIRFGSYVSELIQEDKTVKGVRLANGDEYLAPLVIVANGPSSALADKLLSRSRIDVFDQLLVTKEILVSEDSNRMRLVADDNSAASIIIPGDPLETGFSWARIISYGNKLIIKAYLPYNMVSEKQDPRTFVDRLKMHPSISAVVNGFTSESFTKAIIPVGGFEKYPNHLWGNGFIVTGKAARLYHPFDCRMTDYSIVSGAIAGSSAVDAKLDRHPSRATTYPDGIHNSFLLPDRKSMAAFMNEMRGKRQWSTTYPEILFSMTESVFTMDARKKGVKKSDTIRELRGKSSIWSMLSDFMRLYKLYGHH